MSVQTLGYSVEGRPIVAHTFGTLEHPVLIVGGFHGNEQASVHVSEKLIDMLRGDPGLCAGGGLVVVPNVNPDGYKRGTRKNARAVDLNRNFPTGNWTQSHQDHPSHGGSAPLSEPESRAVLELVQKLKPSLIISVHSITHDRQCNNYDGPARAIATRMGAENGYRVTESMGYPTPGSFGTWAGQERGIPVVTLELPRPAAPERCWDDNRGALLAAIEAQSGAVAMGK